MTQRSAQDNSIHATSGYVPGSTGTTSLAPAPLSSRYTSVHNTEPLRLCTTAKPGGCERNFLANLWSQAPLAIDLQHHGPPAKDGRAMVVNTCDTAFGYAKMLRTSLECACAGEDLSRLQGSPEALHFAACPTWPNLAKIEQHLWRFAVRLCLVCLETHRGQVKSVKSGLEVDMPKCTATIRPIPHVSDSCLH